MKRLWLILATIFLAACGNEEGALALETQAVPSIRVSDARGEPSVVLQGATLSGSKYVFVRDYRIARVGWKIDGVGWRTDRTAPFSLTDNPYNTARLSDGQHAITARIFYRSGSVKTSRATFNVKNASSPPPEPTPEPEPAPSREVVFFDGFSGTSLDKSKWDSCYPWGNEGGYSGFHGDGNCYNKSTGETQLYTSNAKNLSVSDGTLKLTALRETVTKNGKTFPFTSAMIASHPEFGGGFTTRYGLLEARMKLPLTKGVWPAFWTLPYPVEHPPEIDVMETINADSVLRMHYHFEAGSDGENFYGADLSEWHTYAVDWQPGLIVWYFDGVEVFRTTESVTDKPQYLLLNLAIDGWADTPDSSSSFPATVEVDWVRVTR